MLRTRENSDVFNSLEEIYLVFTSKKQISSIYFHYKSMVDNDMPGVWPVWTPGAPLAAFIKESIIHWSTQHMKALGHMVSEKKIFFSFFP